MNQMPGHLEQAEATRLENPIFNSRKGCKRSDWRWDKRIQHVSISICRCLHSSLRYVQLRGFVHGTALATVQVQLGRWPWRLWHLRCTRRPWGARAKPVTWRRRWTGGMPNPGIGPRSLRSEARWGCNLDGDIDRSLIQRVLCFVYHENSAFYFQLARAKSKVMDKMTIDEWYIDDK